MKTKHLLIGVFLSVGFQAQADDKPKWFLGTQYSFNNISSLPDREPETFGLVGGYRISEYFTMEARYSFGTSDYSSSIFVNEEQEEYIEEIDTQAFLLLKASYPIFDSLNFYLMAGISESDYEITTTSSFTDQEGVTTITYPSEINISERGFTYGLGADFRVNRNLSIFVDHMVLPDLEVGSGRANDWNSTNIGVKYSF